MNKETRRICFDETLQIEAYQLCGMIPDLPNHFHEHYAVGVIAAGNRRLRCKNREYLLEPGDIILLNPGESHACAAVDGDLDYRGFNHCAQCHGTNPYGDCRDQGPGLFLKAGGPRRGGGRAHTETA